MLAVNPEPVGRESGEAVVVEVQVHRKRNLLSKCVNLSKIQTEG